MNLGISILFKKSEIQPTELFSFMNPLALEIWLYILMAYVMVSLTIWIVARLIDLLNEVRMTILIVDFPRMNGQTPIPVSILDMSFKMISLLQTVSGLQWER